MTRKNIRRLRPGAEVLLLALCLFLWNPSAFAETYYVDGTSGNDASGNGSSGSPWRTIKKGLSGLEPGDTLVVRDGVYTGEENNISGEFGGYDGMPSGEPGKYITIEAEHYLGAVIDGEDTYRPVFLWENAAYLIFENLHFRNAGPLNGGANFRAQDCRHIKVLNCVSEEAYFGHFWFYNSKYCLVEGCAAWGRSAYSYVFVGEYDDYTRSQYNVVRRCVSRRDVHYYPDHQANHYASFVAYWADNTYFQNCISLDGVHVEDEHNVQDDDWIADAVFFTTNGASNFSAVGCVTVNEGGQAASFSPGDRGSIVFRNNAAWFNEHSTFGVLGFGEHANVYVVNNTIGNVMGTGDYQGAGVAGVEGSFTSVLNNLLMNNRIGLDRVTGPHSYNVLYNDTDYNGTAPGTGDVTNLNPLIEGLTYLIRVEDGSALASAGLSGAQVGACIVERLGVSGTLYGETGWNTLTGESLWPWPNESAIKTRMASYNRHGVNGRRGFCGQGTGRYGGPLTLTSYVWEYLGNPCPAEYCGGANAPANGIWKDLNETFSFYLQKYQAGSCVVLTMTSNTITAFLDSNYKDGVQCDNDLLGQGRSITLNVSDGSQGSLTADLPGVSGTYAVALKYEDISDSGTSIAQNGIWWAGTDEGLKFYLQKYQTGSAVVVALAGGELTAFLDEDYSDGIQCTKDLLDRNYLLELDATDGSQGSLTASLPGFSDTSQVDLCFPDAE
ncbi:MAG: hypothetical protein HY788_19520 [Deltaproteobacteria bacterium]|nr:hypothetical protein [Deltaproteobacteria bacterium]